MEGKVSVFISEFISLIPGDRTIIDCYRREVVGHYLGNTTVRKAS